MTPYEAVYNKKPPMGLTNIGIPREFWQDINTEDDIEVFQKEIAQPSLTEVQVDHELEYLSDVYQSGSRSCSSIPSPPLSKFPTQIDEYETQILTALPVGTIVSDHLVSFNSDVTATTSFDNQLSDDYSATGLQSTSHVPSCSISTLDCVACGGETSGVHSCPRCFGYIHIICGRSEGEEGYGSSVVCPACDISSRKDACNKIRAGIKRCQEKQQDRMLE